MNQRVCQARKQLRDPLSEEPSSPTPDGIHFVSEELAMNIVTSASKSTLKKLGIAAGINHKASKDIKYNLLVSITDIL